MKASQPSGFRTSCLLHVNPLKSKDEWDLTVLCLVPCCTHVGTHWLGCLLWLLHDRPVCSVSTAFCCVCVYWFKVIFKKENIYVIILKIVIHFLKYWREHEGAAKLTKQEGEIRFHVLILVVLIQLCFLICFGVLYKILFKNVLY